MKIKSKSMRKKSVAVLAGLAIAGAVGASAASLGGLGGEDLGADTGDVASCDINGVDVGYTTAFDGALGEYVVNSINLSDIDPACEGQTFDLTLLGDAVAPSTVEPVLATENGTIGLSGGTTQAIDTTGDGLTAESVTGLAMSISGATVTP